MTEQDWLNNSDPVAMFQQLDGRASERKLRFFSIAALMSAGHLDERGHRRCEVCVRFADGTATIHELRELWPRLEHEKPTTAPELAFDWAETIVMAKARGYYGGSFPFLNQSLLCKLLRDIIGNPFRPITFAPTWRSETAVSLAAVIYAERAFDRLPILADALEEAGCDNADVLSHCRGPGPHARGCWVVDGVLGKS